MSGATESTDRLLSYSLRLLPPEGAPPADQEAENRSPSINSLLSPYVTRLHVLYEYIVSVGSLAAGTSASNMFSLVLLFKDLLDTERLVTPGQPPICRAEVTLSSTASEERIVSANVYEEKHLHDLRDFAESQDVALRILNETAIQATVNAYEYLIHEVVRLHYAKNPDDASTDLEISYKKLLAFDSIADAKSYAVDQIVDRLLREDTAGQISQLKKALGIDIQSLASEHIKTLTCLVLTRHAIVHDGGRASAVYIRKCSEFCKKHNLRPGDKIPVDSDFTISGWTAAFVVGAILVHQLATKDARARRSKTDQADADMALVGSAAYRCIERQQYKTAQALLEYANKLTLSGDEPRLMCIINLAQAHLWQDNKTECLKILQIQDWQVCNPLYQLCVAALRSDVDTFRKLLPLVAEQKLAGIRSLHRWPCFRAIREDPQFAEWTTRAFGVTTTPGANHPRAKLIDSDPQASLIKTIRILMSDTSLPATLRNALDIIIARREPRAHEPQSRSLAEAAGSPGP